jgi:hypothetical protein
VEQRIEPLNAEELARLDLMRAWVRDHYTPETQDRFQSYAGKLALVAHILAEGWIEIHETWKLQSLGVVFGDALAQYLDLAWIAVDDEYGRDPALRDPVTSDRVFPLTMISKRIERGEAVDVPELFDWACRAIVERRRERQAE